MTMGDRIYTRRKELDLTLEYVGTFVGVAKSTVRKWETGYIENISALRLQKLAAVLNTTVEYLMDGITSNPIAKNIEPLPSTRPVPLLGKIACGEPILARENIEGFVELDQRIGADFALRCVGDSMINAHIFDGDLVFIKAQPDVDNGQIAAVIIDDEATLKRVYKYPNRLELRPENPLFPVLQFEGPELEKVRIAGRAIAFLGQVR